MRNARGCEKNYGDNWVKTKGFNIQCEYGYEW